MAFAAEGSSNTVEAIDETTGAIVGPPITVGTNPSGIAYWNPVQGDTLDPELIVANKGSNSVTIIDAITRTVITTISLPSGSNPTRVAASPNSPYAVVIDTGTGDVSIINLTNNTDAGEIFLASSSNLLNDVTFAASGSVAFVSNRSLHKIFVVQYTGGSAPYFTNETAEQNPDWQLDLCDEVIGLWRGHPGAKPADMTLVWGRPLLSGGRIATAELADLAVDQCELLDERFTLIAPDDYRHDLLVIKLFDAKGRELARESLYAAEDPDEADGGERPAAG